MHEPNNSNGLAKLAWGFLKPELFLKTVSIFDEPQTGPVWGIIGWVGVLEV